MDDKVENEIKCLDKGFVRLVDVMGDDSSIVQAARVSYGKGTKTVHEDRGLIRYLMRHKHTTPFEMVEFKFHVKLPIFVARQWIRHRTANVNEYSGRYSEMKDEFYLPSSEQIRTQSVINKQGRADETLPSEHTAEILDSTQAHYEASFELYQSLLEKGLTRELSRMVLPVANYTEWYWKIDLHNLFHFLKLRLDTHAQYEIRVYAEAMAELVKAIVPLAWEAYEHYMLNSIMLTQGELSILADLLPPTELDVEQCIKYGLSKREAGEFVDKFNKIKKLSSNE
ncbi:MAG: thymidylate synthase (FAD) [Ignavibacteriae bacterium HGW-Ignavibacteriae-1]|nr:MAG: thymidylate synthase (FAD) [Ignavibacteriae bacterium HGW-Ignavibacteriae-1]